LIERGAQLLQATTTSASYRLYALPGGPPFRPGLVRVPSGGRCIELEVWSMPMTEAGAFLASIPPPLGLGSVELADGSRVHGFLCESHALAKAADISEHGGWRGYLAAQAGAVRA
jgi:allophanate hydrolase